MLVLKNIQIEYEEAENLIKEFDESEVNHLISRLLKEEAIKRQIEMKSKAKEENPALKELNDLFEKAENILKNRPKNEESYDDIKYQYLTDKHLR